MAGFMQAAMAAAPGVYVTVASAPPSLSNSSAAAAFTFAAVTVTVTGGTASSYTWGFTGGYGGTFEVFAGQGTATGTPRVTAVSAGLTADANFYCDVVVDGVTYRATSTLSHTNTNSA